MLKREIPFLLALALLLPPSAAAAEGAPDISAASAVVMAEDGTCLFERAADERRLIASTTKLMTALIVLENGGLDDEVEMLPDWCGIEGTSLYLHQGDRCRVRELLTGLLLASANDAAVALACHTAGSVEAFAARMNRKAAELGMTNTHYVNPHGLDEEGQYSSARDLARLMLACMANDDFAALTAQRYGTAGEQSFENHNKLLWRLDGCIGGKTGYTRAAGRCLVSCVEREGTRFVCVTLSDPDDWNDHERLYAWAYNNYVNLTVTDGLSYDVPVLSGDRDRLAAVPAEPCRLLKKRGAELELCAELPRFVFAPVQPGSEAGLLRICCGEEELAVIPLVYAEGAEVRTSYGGTHPKNHSGSGAALPPGGGGSHARRPRYGQRNARADRTER